MRAEESLGHVPLAAAVVQDGACFAEGPDGVAGGEDGIVGGRAGGGGDGFVVF